MPEVTADYIRIPVRPASEFITGTYATISVSAREGIKAIIGRLSSKKNRDKSRIRTYLFARAKGWTMAKAREWLDANKRSTDMLREPMEESGDYSRQIDSRLEVREDKVTPEEGEPRTEGRITGYAVVWNAETQIGDPSWGFREVFERGAFKRTLQERDQVALWAHDRSQLPLGKRSNQTLRLTEDDYGLRAEIHLPDSQFARDLMESVRRGDIDGMSFGFIPTKWDEADGPDNPLRTVKEAILAEVSLVTLPQYVQTSIVDAREIAAQVRGVDIPDDEDTLDIDPDVEESESARRDYLIREDELDREADIDE